MATSISPRLQEFIIKLYKIALGWDMLHTVTMCPFHFFFSFFLTKFDFNGVV